MDRLVDLIKVYDNDLEDDICDYLVYHFEKSFNRHKKTLRNRTPNFTEYNLSRNAWRNKKTKKIYDLLINQIHHRSKDYFKYINDNFNYLFPKDRIYSNTVFPKSYNIERVRIKRYIPNMNEAFDTHVDSINLLSCSRFVSFLWYLNDVEDGGHTVFNGMRVDPRKGRLVMFPPLWPYPHAGEEPESNTKYIMSSYLRYNNILNNFSLKNLWEVIR